MISSVNLSKEECKEGASQQGERGDQLVAGSQHVDDVVVIFVRERIADERCLGGLQAVGPAVARIRDHIVDVKVALAWTMVRSRRRGVVGHGGLTNIEDLATHDSERVLEGADLNVRILSFECLTIVVVQHQSVGASVINVATSMLALCHAATGRAGSTPGCAGGHR